MTGKRLIAPGTPQVAGLIVFLAATAITAAAQSPNRAGVVVRFDDQQVETRCVEFSEPAISGYELLRRSGLAVEGSFGGLGGLACRIDGTGCPAENCFCQCQGPECSYWSYWHWQGDAWQYAQSGATTYQASHGSLDGWSWGLGTVASAVPPPAVTFADVCSTGASAIAPATAEKGASFNPWRPILLFGAFVLLVALLVNRWQRRRTT